MISAEQGAAATTSGIIAPMERTPTQNVQIAMDMFEHLRLFRHEERNLQEGNDPGKWRREGEGIIEKKSMSFS